MKWPRNNLTYKITKYTKQLPKEVVDNQIKNAFTLWSQVTPLKFIKTSSGKCENILYFY